MSPCVVSMPTTDPVTSGSVKCWVRSTAEEAVPGASWIGSSAAMTVALNNVRHSRDSTVLNTARFAARAARRRRVNNWDKRMVRFLPRRRHLPPPFLIIQRLRPSGGRSQLLLIKPPEGLDDLHHEIPGRNAQSG